MDKEVLEVVLKKFDRESKIVTILDMQAVSALPKGENYTSTILRITLKVVLGNGRLAKKSLIMKQLITEGETGELVKELNTAKMESQIYSVVHKEMNYLMEEFKDNEEPLWCKFIHYDPKLSCLLLEDLKASGYNVVPRQMGLDLEHSVLVLRGLGKYHAMSKVLEERGMVFKDYNPDDVFYDLNFIKNFFYSGISNVSKALQKSWGPEWIEIGKKLMVPFDPFAAKWCSMRAIQADTNFPVLNHGDCWSNNLMFKYDFQKRPVSVKFVDYQIPRYNCPCVDINTLFYLSVEPAVRRTKYHILLKAYHDSLIRYLDKFGYTGLRPSLEEMTARMKNLEFSGLTVFVSIYPSLCTSAKGVDFDKILRDNGGEGFDNDIWREPGVIEKLGPDIIDYVERHLSHLH